MWLIKLGKCWQILFLEVSLLQDSSGLLLSELTTSWGENQGLKFSKLLMESISVILQCNSVGIMLQKALVCLDISGNVVFSLKGRKSGGLECQTPDILSSLPGVPQDYIFKTVPTAQNSDTEATGHWLDLAVLGLSKNLGC